MGLKIDCSETITDWGRKVKIFLERVMGDSEITLSWRFNFHRRRVERVPINRSCLGQPPSFTSGVLTSDD